MRDNRPEGLMDFVEQLKSSVQIETVIGEYVRLRKSGVNRYVGLCPFHNEKSGSFTVHAAEQFGLGYSDRSGRALLRLFERHSFTPEQMEQSGLVGKRQDGSFYDRFRNRLMFPIRNESGKIIGYGGRALSPDDEPKYLNSP